jgi:hypothetical protein
MYRCTKTQASLVKLRRERTREKLKIGACYSQTFMSLEMI